MDSYKETFDTWNKLANAYQDRFMNLDLYDKSYDHFCDALPTQNAKILEIGCGPGNITKYLLSKRPDFHIFGIDIAPNMVELAKKNNPTAGFAVMDSREINTLKERYHGIIAGFCLPYLSATECKELICSSAGLLNENGVIYLSFVEGDADQSGFKESNSGRVYFYYHQLEALKTALHESGFSDVEISRVDYRTSETSFDTHTILTAKKQSQI